ncbi:hypothetical protein COL154_008703 [Colletotrichum chrysophilum]|nr:hypothetical protein COL154_008703 [Colletotrichum chrysophilum]
MAMNEIGRQLQTATHIIKTSAAIGTMDQTLYGNEADVGRSLQQYLEQAKAQREDFFLTTKVGRHEGSVEKTYRSVLRSVRRIAGEDGYVDLFLVHRPIQRREEVWVALERLLEEGKTRAIGVSNFRAEHLEEMKGYAKVWPPVVNQIEVLVRWSVQNGFVPLVKSSDPARIEENANIFSFELDEEEMQLLDDLDMGAQGALFPANVS